MTKVPHVHEELGHKFWFSANLTLGVTCFDIKKQKQYFSKSSHGPSEGTQRETIEEAI